MSELGQKLIATARRLAEEDPRYVYQPPDGDMCQYVFEGAPSCLIGRVLWEHGLIDASLERAERIPSVDGFPHSPANWASARDLLHWLGLAQGMDFSEVEWLVVVQRHQDNEEAWGQAVHLADVEVILESK